MGIASLKTPRCPLPQVLIAAIARVQISGRGDVLFARLTGLFIADATNCGGGRRRRHESLQICLGVSTSADHRDMPDGVAYWDDAGADGGAGATGLVPLGRAERPKTNGRHGALMRETGNHEAESCKTVGRISRSQAVSDP
jgi:hypothetical protein